jgi:hypothetical protein
MWNHNAKRNIFTVVNIASSNQGKVRISIKTKLEIDIEPASCEQLQTVFISYRQSFLPAPCERDLILKMFEKK